MYQEVEIILSSSFLPLVVVLFHMLFLDDNMFYTLAHSMYQEVELYSVLLFCLQLQYCSIHFAKMTTFFFVQSTG